MLKCKNKQETNKFKCQCAKSYKYKQGLEKHQVKCTTYQSTLQNNTANSSEVCIVGGNNNTINNTTNNDNSTNNTTNNSININPVGYESLDHLTPKDINNVCVCR